jgi:hypothetical protein
MREKGIEIETSLRMIEKGIEIETSLRMREKEVEIEKAIEKEREIKNVKNINFLDENLYFSIVLITARKLN